MSRAATSKGNLLRLGFQDSDAALDSLRLLGDAAEPLLALLGRTADPDAALSGLLRLRDVLDDPDALIDAIVDDEGTAMRLLCVLGASEALADHLVRHPEHWRELTDPVLGSTRPAAWTMRESLLAAVTGKPDATGRGRRASRRVPPAAAAPGRAGPDPPPRRGRRRRGALRPGRRDPRGRPGGRPAAGRTTPR